MRNSGARSKINKDNLCICNMGKDDLLRTENVALSGIYVSTLIIIASLLVNFSLKIGQYFDLSINSSINSYLVFLVGLSMLFYFVSIKLNQTEHQEGSFVCVRLSETKSYWSGNAFSISVFLFICSLIWIMILIMKEIIK